jgi:hypothetical protein
MMKTGRNARDDRMRYRTTPLEALPAGLKAALEYWRGLGGEQLACGWREFDILRIPARLLPSTLVIDVFADTTLNRFRYWGSAMTELHGYDMTGQSPYDIRPADMVPELRRQHEESRTTGDASASRYAFMCEPGFEHVHYALRLPLSGDGKAVSQIVVITDVAEGEGPLVDL